MANNQDASPIRTYTEVERRIQGLIKNLNRANTRVVQINNELATIMKSLLINLSEYMNQGEVALWFYSGVPTMSNEPYIDWESPSEHEGDFYYDKETGLVYQFSLQNNWQNIQDNDLVQAMSLTNSELQSGGNERKVFLSQPIPPYDSGDWYIKDNGDLYICQIGKDISEEYGAEDFVISSLYQMTVAAKSAETLTVLKGTVMKISEDYVSVTDLATGGSTVIAGENISTGSLKSNNYVANTSGTKIDLSTGTIDTKNFKVSNTGIIEAIGAIFRDILIKEGKLQFNDGLQHIASMIFTDPKDETDIKSAYYSNMITVGIDPNAEDYGLADGATMEGAYDETYKKSFGGFTARANSQLSNKRGYVCWDTEGDMGYDTGIGANFIETIQRNYSTGTETKTRVTPQGITTPTLTQTSIESKKKNIKTFEDALEIVKNTDIYKYHLLSQKDTEKKHVGFVIGNKYKYSEVITNNDNTGVDLYSMISVLWQAVKQQQEEIENLRKGG